MNLWSFFPNTTLTVAATVVLAGLGIAGWIDTGSADSTKGGAISGSWDSTYAKKEAAPVGQPDQGHVLLLTIATAKNVNTSSGSDFMDGADVTDDEIADLNQGNDPHQGYGTMTKGADSALFHWQGKITTTLNADKTPKTTFAGKWNYVSGTGQYAGITGGGSYSGKATGENTLHVEWMGSYSLGKTAEVN